MELIYFLWQRVLQPMDRYEGQRDMLYNQTFNLDQVEFASEGIKDAKQTVCSMELLDMVLLLLLLLFVVLLVSF